MGKFTREGPLGELKSHVMDARCLLHLFIAKYPLPTASIHLSQIDGKCLITLDEIESNLVERFVL